MPLEALPEVPCGIGFYGLGVALVYGLSGAWFFRKPSGWSRVGFVLLSVLWVFMDAWLQPFRSSWKRPPSRSLLS